MGTATSLFHTSTIVYRRRNKVEELEDVNGNWVTEQDQLKFLATDDFFPRYIFLCMDG